MDIGNQLALIRRGKNISQMELGRQLGIKNISGISKLETGVRLPSLSTAFKIAKILQVRIDDIWFLKEK